MASRMGTIRCTEIKCTAYYVFESHSPLEHRAVLAANALAPWRCVRHGGKRSEAAA